MAATGRLSSTFALKPLADTPVQPPRLPIPSSSTSSLKRSFGSTSDLVTPAYKRRAYADPTPTVPSSAERIQAEQARRGLTHQIATLERQVSEVQKQLREAHSEIAERDRRIVRLEEDRRIIAEREVDFKKESRETEADLRTAKASLEKERDREAERARESVDAAARSDSIARRQTHEADLARSKAEGAARQVDALQAELIRSDEELERVRGVVETVGRERDALHVRIDDLERRCRDGGTATGDSQIKLVREELHRQVTHLKTLEGANARLNRENAALKERSADAAILREQVQTLDNKLKLTDKLRRQLAAVEAECEALRQMQQEWRVYLRTDEDATTHRWDTPRQVGKALAAVQLENASLHERLGRMHSDVTARDALIEALELRLDEAEVERRVHAEAQAEADKLTARNTRLIDLVTREADMLREQLRTYATEETSIGGTAGPRTEAIYGLDELLDAHKRELHEANNEIDRLRGLIESSGGLTSKLEGVDGESLTMQWRRQGKLGDSLSDQLKANEGLRHELAAAQEEVDLLSKDVASLEAQCERLSTAVGRGEYDASTTRVLQFVDNPASQDLAIRTSTLEALRNENAALVARLSKAALGVVDGAVPIETVQNLNQDVERLKAEVHQSAMKSQRLKEMFNQRASDMRGAVYALFGFKFDFKENGRIRITSMYAHSDDDHLIFEPISPTEGRKGQPVRFRLAGGTGDAEWAKVPTVQSALQFWITDRQCIPGFLSSLTLESYEQATRGGKHLGYTQG